MSPDFLDAENVLEIHRLQLARLGGSSGVRDRGLLEADELAAALRRLAMPVVD